jgi:hypothetical protein
MRTHPSKKKEPLIKNIIEEKVEDELKGRHKLCESNEVKIRNWEGEKDGCGREMMI